MSVITGYFPVVGSEVHGANIIYKVQKGSKYESTTYTSNDGDLPVADLLRQYAHNMTNITSGYGSNHFGPYGCTVQGKPSPVPVDKYLEGPKIRVNNKIFKKRVRAGEMIFSNYSNVVAHLSYRNGGVFTPLGKPELRGWSVSSLSQFGYQYSNAWGPWQGFAKLDEFSGIWGTFRTYYQRASITDTVSPYEVGWDDQVIQRFINGLKPSDDDVTKQVTETLSEANAASVDILTSVAEAPETVRSLINLVKQSLLGAKAVKNKELRLLEREKRVRVEYVAKVKRQEFENSKAFQQAKTERKKRLAVANGKRKLKQLALNFKRELEEITSAIATVWMTYRYEIMPNVLTIKGALEALDKKLNVFDRWRSLDSVKIEWPEIPGWKTPPPMSIQLRTCIKRKFEDISGYRGIIRSLSSNIALTAWELVPLSYVIDWFINIGHFLSSYLGSNQVDYKQASSISWKITNSVGNYTHETGASVRVDIRGYVRNVINPDDYCRIHWDPDVTGFRVYDSLALTWQMFLKKLTRSGSIKPISA